MWSFPESSLFYSFLMNQNFQTNISIQPQQQIFNPKTLSVSRPVSHTLQKQLNDLQYFEMFFSTKKTAESLKRRNQNLQMIDFDKSDQEPDQVYNRRQKKLSDLIQKQNEQLEILLQIREESFSKYTAIINFVKFFIEVKRTVSQLRVDYYSTKTFYALKNSTESSLLQVLNVLKNMYKKIISEIKIDSQCYQRYQRTLKARSYEFLIIPRFLISKEKIIRLANDQILQQNLQFLIINQCLGHYNNEANKKMPEKEQINALRDLLMKKDGRQKFKKICSINHGSKFVRDHHLAYYQLYNKSLQYLKFLDQQLKRGKKFNRLKQQLEKYNVQNEETIVNSSFNDTSSISSNIYSFKSFNECLNKIQEQHSRRKNSMGQEVKGQKSNLVINDGRRLLKLKSTPTIDYDDEIKEKNQQNIVVQNQPAKKFTLRKLATLQGRTIQNIILKTPPNQYQSNISK